MAGSRQKIIETLQSVDTVLITVGKNPSVDELSAALGLTIFLNESGKHATAVMSGDIPPAISFLEPEKTFENSVDSLRDFVIALDKDKADHLRYKLVDDVVKIFITPYRAVISEKDLRYSKGDYNVELVLAIGVKTRDDLDKALVSHGRILHDATVATIGNEESKLGDPDWYNREASSLCEMVTTLITKFSEDRKMDKRVASALLTGIVSATDRFSNDRTSPESLTIAAELMSYGANQQLIALKLREGSKMEIQPEDGSKKLTRDLEKDSRKQSGNNANNKKQSKKEKDRTKLSIDHNDSEQEESKDDNRNNQSKKSNNNRPKQEKRQDKEPVKSESNSDVNAESKSEEKPAETTAPNRIGLTEDGEYNPAAALDEALRLSEQKRAEEVSEDKDKLADELARSLEQASQVPQPEQIETPMPYELLDNNMPQAEETPQPEETTQPEEPTREYIPQETEQPAPVQEQTSQAYNPEQQYEPQYEAQPEQQPQQEPQQQPEQYDTYETPQPQSSELPSLPPVEQSPIIGEARQNNTSTDLVDPDESPTFGGVLNATTESAAEAKKMLESEMRNRTILSRSTPGTQAQADNQPSTPPPFNSIMTGNEEPTMPSFDMSAPQMQQNQQMQSQQQVFEPASNYTYQGQTIVPPTPTGTLEEIDRQHRQPQPIEDTEVRDMFEPSSQPLPAPSVPIGQPTSIQAPNTPPPPPMPDFSQLPPLPTQMPDFSQVPAQMPPDAPEPGPDNIGQILSPAPPMPPQNMQDNDPGQFQIPNQQ